MAEKMSKLDLCWKNCMSMWARVVKEIKGGSTKTPHALKDIWCEDHGFKDKIHCDCFFCEYAGIMPNGDEDCKKCPGVLVDPDFDCADDKYYYSREPIKFLNKLRALNRKRLKK